MSERPIADVPKPALLLLALGLALQIFLQATRPAEHAAAVNLPPPPSSTALRLSAFGEPVALSKILMLYVQAFDSQAGVLLPYRELDYANLESWLARILELDPSAQYPLFAAARLYAGVPDQARQRSMLEFIHTQFLLDPNRRWPWMAQAALVAKHELKDLPLARRYAQAIRLHATGHEVPDWAKDLEVLVLQDMDELQSAKVLIGGLLESGRITDPHELRFLRQRLDELEGKTAHRP